MHHDPEVSGLLRHINGFELLDDRSVASLTATASLRSFAENTAVYEEDEETCDIYFIVNGIVSIRSRLPAEREQYTELLTLRSGRFFGVLSFLDGARRDMGAYARERSLLISFDGLRLRAACEDDTVLGRAVYLATGVSAARMARDVSMELRNYMAERM
jgi:CRP-like cAMP-binding protein